MSLSFRTRLQTATMAFSLLVLGQANGQIVFVDDAVSTDLATGSETFSASGLSAHTTITINFDLFIMDSWDGSGSFGGPDVFGFRVDGVEKFSASFGNFSSPIETNTVVETARGNFNGINTWGAIDRYFDDYAGGFTFAHTGSTLDLTFFGQGLQVLSDESWRVNDIDVSSNSVLAVTEPSTLLLMGFSLLGIGLAKRRNK